MLPNCLEKWSTKPLVFLFQNEKQEPSGEEINRKKHPYKLIKLTN